MTQSGDANKANIDKQKGTTDGNDSESSLNLSSDSEDSDKMAEQDADALNA